MSIYKDLDVRSTSLHIVHIHNKHNHNIILIYIYNIVLVILMIVGVSLTIPDRQQKPIYFLCQYDEPSSVAKVEMSYCTIKWGGSARNPGCTVFQLNLYIYILYTSYILLLKRVALNWPLSTSCCRCPPEPLQLGLFCQKQLCQDSAPWGDQKVTMKSERKWMNIYI